MLCRNLRTIWRSKNNQYAEIIWNAKLNKNQHFCVCVCFNFCSLKKRNVLLPSHFDPPPKKKNGKPQCFLLKTQKSAAHMLRNAVLSFHIDDYVKKKIQKRRMPIGFHWLVMPISSLNKFIWFLLKKKKCLIIPH